MIRNYSDLTRKEMEKVDKERTIVLIPLGALEQHGSQAPLGTDDIIAKAMADEVVRQLGEEEPDFPMLVFPVIPVGLSTEHKRFCGSITLRPQTYYHVLYEIGESLARHGFRKLAFLVCHGGNAPLAQVVSRELRSDFGTAVFVISSGSFGHPDVKATVSEGNVWDFHGGEMETSVVMAVDESLVKLKLSEPGVPSETLQKTMFAGGAQIGWVSEDFRTADGRPIGIGGDPRGASAEKGRIIIETSAREIVRALKKIREV